MNYDEKLVQRISRILERRRGITTRKMFGGICFMLNGNMLCGIAKGKLVARVGPDAYEKALQQKYARPMDFTGKPLKGMVYVLPEGIKSSAALKGWIDKSIGFVNSLPRKAIQG